ncbi:hypothetical protein PsorP6_007665 [Peronosclerospora sorghi]|uniref:Uncharacterized protein n=1 Tax=Peronosclerospora sorghi TaxID=230839 RepID=A0ACC0W9S0_9STRA|nr:hypothetical protein PsorP6_007665 [Peronosclerospora sorghi]
MNLNHLIYSNVQLKISRYALFQSDLQYRKVLAASSLRYPSPLANCTGAFTLTMGIPCAHAIAEIPDGQKLQMSDFHQQWWLARQQPALIREPSRGESTIIPMLTELETQYRHSESTEQYRMLESIDTILNVPLVTTQNPHLGRQRGRPRESTARHALQSSTRRDPSHFEVACLVLHTVEMHDQ